MDESEAVQVVSDNLEEIFYETHQRLFVKPTTKSSVRASVVKSVPQEEASRRPGVLLGCGDSDGSRWGRVTPIGPQNVTTVIDGDEPHAVQEGAEPTQPAAAAPATAHVSQGMREGDDLLEIDRGQPALQELSFITALGTSNVRGGTNLDPHDFEGKRYRGSNSCGPLCDVSCQRTAWTRGRQNIWSSRKMNRFEVCACHSTFVDP